MITTSYVQKVVATFAGTCHTFVILCSLSVVFALFHRIRVTTYVTFAPYTISRTNYELLTDSLLVFPLVSLPLKQCFLQGLQRVKLLNDIDNIEDFLHSRVANP